MWYGVSSIFAGELFRQDFPFSVDDFGRVVRRIVGWWDTLFFLRGVVRFFRQKSPVGQLELQLLVRHGSVLSDKLFQFQRTGDPNVVSLSDLASLELLCQITPGPHMDMLGAGIVSVSDPIRSAKVKRR